jgi:hypothetical protein
MAQRPTSNLYVDGHEQQNHDFHSHQRYHYLSPPLHKAFTQSRSSMRHLSIDSAAAVTVRRVFARLARSYSHSLRNDHHPTKRSRSTNTARISRRSDITKGFHSSLFQSPHKTRIRFGDEIILSSDRVGFAFLTTLLCGLGQPQTGAVKCDLQRVTHYCLTPQAPSRGADAAGRKAHAQTIR